MVLYVAIKSAFQLVCDRNFCLSPCHLLSFGASHCPWLNSIGVSTGLHPSFFCDMKLPISFKKSNTYFCYDMKIPCLECATTITRNYFNLPSSLVSNSLSKHYFKLCIPSTSVPVTMMSSTYTNNVVTPPNFECFTNKV